MAQVHYSLVVSAPFATAGEAPSSWSPRSLVPAPRVGRRLPLLRGSPLSMCYLRAGVLFPCATFARVFPFPTPPPRPCPLSMCYLRAGVLFPCATSPRVFTFLGVLDLSTHSIAFPAVLTPPPGSGSGTPPYRCKSLGTWIHGLTTVFRVDHQ